MLGGFSRVQRDTEHLADLARLGGECFLGLDQLRPSWAAQILQIEEAQGRALEIDEGLGGEGDARRDLHRQGRP